MEKFLLSCEAEPQHPDTDSRLGKSRLWNAIELERKYTVTLNIQEWHFETAHPSLLIFFFFFNSISKCFLCSTPAIDSSCPATRTMCEEFCVNIVQRDTCFLFQLLHSNIRQTRYAGNNVRNPTLPVTSAIYQEYSIRGAGVGGHLSGSGTR